MAAQGRKALIDGDIIIYRSAFAAERAKYVLHQDDGIYIEFGSKKEADAHIKKHNLVDYALEKTRVIEPLENALGNAKECLEKILNTLETRDYMVYLTGRDNFRRLIPSYKANRDPSMKPYWMDEVVLYLKKYWGAEQVDGMEADDAIAIASSDPQSVIVSTDKDLDTLPGWHYNWVKQEIYEVSEDDADKNFWTQMLTGDRSDNVLGIPGVGPVGAAGLLAECGSPEHRRDAVLNAYAEEFGHEKGAQEFSTNAVLLRICRTQKELEDNTKLAGVYSGKDLAVSSDNSEEA
jgi:5'-3' exonuclease